MILDRTEDPLLNDDKAGTRKPPLTDFKPEDGPPAYSQAVVMNPSSSQAVSLSTNGQAVVPSNVPINGLQMYTKRQAIRGSWSLDPQAPLVPAQSLVQMFLDGTEGKKKRWYRSRAAKIAPPTAMFSSRHASIQATLYVVGESAARSVATIRSTTRRGGIVLDLAYIAPMRTVHIDARARRGGITLLVPRNFRGLVQLSSRGGEVELLPALAASSRVIKSVKKETTVHLGDGPMPVAGSDITTDIARLYSRHGCVRLGYSGEDHITKPPGLVDQAMQLMQKLIAPSSQSRCRALGK